MDENNSIIYGLESQARSLTPQLAEPKEIRFFIATQTLKPSNQLHLIELSESSASLSAKVNTPKVHILSETLIQYLFGFVKRFLLIRWEKCGN